MAQAPEIKLNIYGDELHFYFGGDLHKINLATLRDGSSTVFIQPQMGKAFLLYNFREILQLVGTTPVGIMNMLRINAWMQLDKRGQDKAFIKVTVPSNQAELLSDTDDFSLVRHCLPEDIHPLDWEYSWTNEVRSLEFPGNKVKITIEHRPSEFCTTPVYLSHAGQTARLESGRNEVVFTYIDTEDAYVGNSPYGRYVGRRVVLGAHKDKVA
jgi:hypothetical protein